MTDDEKGTYDRHRYMARMMIAQVGMNHYQGASIAVAKGMLAGIVDEMKTQIGERATFDFISSVADGLVPEPVMNGDAIVIKRNPTFPSS